MHLWHVVERLLIKPPSACDAAQNWHTPGGGFNFRRSAGPSRCCGSDCCSGSASCSEKAREPRFSAARLFALVRVALAPIEAFVVDA